MTQPRTVGVDVWRTKPSRGLAGILVGFFGWMACGAGLICVLGAVYTQGRRLAAVQQRLEPALAEIRAEPDQHPDDSPEEKRLLTEAVNGVINHQEDLTLQIKGLELKLGELEPRVKTLARTEKALLATLESPGGDDAGAAQGDESLQKEIAELTATRDRLNDTYRVRFLALEEAYEQARDDSDPERIRDFYDSHQHTVFAPAAAYYAAEKRLADGRAQDALRLYKELLRRYPHSVYAREAAGRIGQIEDGAPYTKPSGPVTLEPYLPHLLEK